MSNVFERFGALVDQVGPIRSLIHVGANRGQEMRFYEAAGVEDITLVEPIPKLVAELRERFPGAKVVKAAVGRRGRAVFSVHKKTDFSSLRKPHRRDRVARRIRVSVIPLSDLGPADCLVVDTQGTELDVLRSGPLDYRVVIVETCTADDPGMASSHDSVVEYMESQGFGVVAIWGRPYLPIAKRSRGVATGSASAEVRDVVFTRP